MAKQGLFAFKVLYVAKGGGGGSYGMGDTIAEAREIARKEFAKTWGGKPGKVVVQRSDGRAGWLTFDPATLIPCAECGAAATKFFQWKRDGDDRATVGEFVCETHARDRQNALNMVARPYVCRGIGDPDFVR